MYLLPQRLRVTASSPFTHLPATSALPAPRFFGIFSSGGIDKKETDFWFREQCRELQLKTDFTQSELS
ncbi:hypothetical protein HETIRDRAFT_327948 [Heterobasidion irregulare TC 32-1]|uniref:Uncharacterized protein n=1 Tax=Heterobasidion irregulare (strain TC 32-1) TaxID=747525 RepID=W4JS61_HETIT|nr:uncharacterized protein HETIRDRAFT_327948 [Heterobasidion irregulare TC 32-1]ETW76378.1 hypothetical protein HETIRDRAFT_327948 [Heterobasidion irregulare TC 32-1]